LLNDPVVHQALDQAWVDSQPGDPGLRHEEGGWIYMDATTGQLTIQRARPGIRAAIDLDNPPQVAGAVVVGVFHTHPNPSADGWFTGPSPSDQAIDAFNGVPDLIRSEDGVHFSGPASRRGGLGGGPGYPP
jgi:hypothetical protein